MHPETEIETAGVPNRLCILVNFADRNPSCAIANGIRVLANTVLFSRATFATIAASVTHAPSHGPPINCAAFAK